MLDFLAPYKKFFIIFGILSIIIYFGIYNLLSPEKMLPIYSPRDINPELVDSTVQHIGNDHKIADFAFTNQNGKVITQKDYENTVYVADFFFTTCPTICPKMTDNMVWLQNQLNKQSKGIPVFVVTHYPLQTGDVDNWYTLTDLIRQYNVQLVLNGHYHRNALLNYDEIPGIVNRTTQRKSGDNGAYTIYSIDSSIRISEKRVGQTAEMWIELPFENKTYAEPDTSLRQ